MPQITNSRESVSCLEHIFHFKLGRFASEQQQMHHMYIATSTLGSSTQIFVLLGKVYPFREY